MNRIQHVSTMATYNLWMNEKIYSNARQLSNVELQLDKGAFFGSILGTLNHLAVADTLWLKRFSEHPSQFQALNPIRQIEAPKSLNTALYNDIEALRIYRKTLDNLIQAMAGQITDACLDHNLKYKNTQGIECCKNFYALLMHFFNHQTHHRGQATTLFSQLGIDVGVTDLHALLPDV